MHEVGAFEAKNKLGTLLDWVAKGEEVVITRHGKAVARLVPIDSGFDHAKAQLAATRLRERAARAGAGFDWAEWKSYRDEGRP